MELLKRAYTLFNECECWLWWIFAASCFYRFIQNRRLEQSGSSILLGGLTIGFLAFGLSDWLEADTNAHLPAWLWFWKITNGMFLFGLLVWRDYERRGKQALHPLRFVAAGGILSVALYLMEQT